MSDVDQFARQASELAVMLSNTSEHEVLAHADEILLLLNRLQDFLRHHSASPIDHSSFSDIIYGLESDPVLTLRDRSIHVRLLNLFMKLSAHHH